MAAACLFGPDNSRGGTAVDLEVDASHSNVSDLYKRFGFVHLNRTRWVRRLSAEEDYRE